MATTGLEVFDTTVQRTNIWLKAIMEEIGSEDRHLAYLALRATLHALRDRLPPEAAVHLGAQLPMLLRGLYYEGWHPAGTPDRERRVEDFLDHVRGELPPDLAEEAEGLVTASLGVLASQVDRGEALKVIRMLPAPLRALWPADLGDG